jgi:hypothetical protein
MAICGLLLTRYRKFRLLSLVLLIACRSVAAGVFALMAAPGLDEMIADSMTVLFLRSFLH